ncbi:MAG TPA: hypothetical protein VJU16_02065, partial [Planctomycetota bacterium]|nr:hypothetical protein [Planctomycetota bacterium]
MRALRRLLDRLDPETIRDHLWVAVDDDSALQRRAFDLFKENRDPALWEHLKSLLEEIHNPDVAAEVLHLVKVEKDPSRRQFLAGLMASQRQREGFEKASLDLLSDRDPEVVRLALGGIVLRRIEDPSERRRASESAAGAGQPVAL